MKKLYYIYIKSLKICSVVFIYLFTVMCVFWACAGRVQRPTFGNQFFPSTMESEA